MRTHILTATTHWNTGHFASCTNIYKYWPELGEEVHLYCHQASARLKRAWRHGLHTLTPKILPDPVISALQKSVSKQFFDRRLLTRLVRSVQPGDFAVVWPGAPIESFQALKDAGCLVGVEFINNHCRSSYEILVSEYKKLDIPLELRIDENMIAVDDYRINMADFLFCSNPYVEESILQSHSVRHKIISTARGTDLKTGQSAKSAPNERFTFVFVGAFCVRKGAPHLVEAMRRFDSSVQLLVAGKVTSEMTRWLADRGVPDNIEFLGFVQNISEVYVRSHALVFPSLEEGGPKVCYEAAAHALPMVVTRMGGGRIAEDGETAFVTPPSDTESLVDAMRRLVSNRAVYETMSERALERASDFSWRAVAADRHAKLKAKGV